jgi:Ca2+-binding RTX toxin-like protein
VAGAIETVLTDSLAEGPLHGGRVDFSGDSDAPAGLVFDVMGAWNSVKNAVFVCDEAQRVTLSGFVHTDVTLGGGGDSFVLLLGAKRGNVVTAGGDDLVVVEAATNLFGWVNEFRIATGDGDDTVVVRPLDIAWAATSDATFAATANGAGAFAADDAATSSFVALGAGDDRFLGEGLSADGVDGGTGDDMISAGRGDDTLTGGAGDDLFVLAAGDGQDSVLDFTVGADRLLVLGLDADGAAAMLAAAVQDGADAVLAIDGGSVRLVGVAAADLSLGDIL